MSKIQIIATLGPATTTKESIRGLVRNGMTMARLNFSFGTHEEMDRYITMVREVAKEEGVSVPIIQDLSGPREVTETGHQRNAFLTEVITEKDRQDLLFGVAHDVEYVALSYVATEKDIHMLRELMLTMGALAPVIAKIERVEALNALDAIIKSADGVMVARGDLSKAFPKEDVPALERLIIDRCKKEGRFVIVATEMLLSMTKKENPTIAEINDVATAIFLGADAVMLSEETAKGEYPLQAVAEMKKIVEHSLRTKEEGICS